MVIAGPTATGKTRLAVQVAHCLGSEIVSADSRQVYRGLDLGTGKDLEEYRCVDPPVRHHLIDVVEPDRVYTPFDFQRDAYAVFREAAGRNPFSGGGVPLLLVGGSGLYAEAVVRGYRIADVGANADLRRTYSGWAREDLAALLRAEAPEVAAQTDGSSRRRLIRGLEIAEARKHGPVPLSEPLDLDVAYKVFAVSLPLPEIRARITARLAARLQAGLVDEVRALLDSGLPRSRLDSLGMEYRWMAAHLAGEMTLDAAVERLEVEIGRLAKRQLTYLRGMERRGLPVRWIGPDDSEAVLSAVRQTR